MNKPEEQNDRRAERDALRRSLRAADEELSALILREKVTLRGILDPTALEQQRQAVRAALNTLPEARSPLPPQLEPTQIMQVLNAANEKARKLCIHEPTTK